MKCRSVGGLILAVVVMGAEPRVSAEPAQADLRPGLDVPEATKKKFEALREKATRPARWLEGAALDASAPVSVKARLHSHGDGLVLVGTLLTAAQQEVLRARGAPEVETAASIRSGVLHEGWYYQRYATRGVEPVVLDTRVGQAVTLEVARTRDGHPVVVGVSGR